MVPGGASASLRKRTSFGVRGALLTSFKRGTPKKAPGHAKDLPANDRTELHLEIVQLNFNDGQLRTAVGDFDEGHRRY